MAAKVQQVEQLPPNGSGSGEIDLLAITEQRLTQLDEQLQKFDQLQAERTRLQAVQKLLRGETPVQSTAAATATRRRKSSSTSATATAEPLNQSQTEKVEHFISSYSDDARGPLAKEIEAETKVKVTKNAMRATFGERVTLSAEQGPYIRFLLSK